MLYSNQAITFHDASIFAVPHSYSFLFRTKYQTIFRSLSRIARIIFTDSKFSQAELSQHLKHPLERFNVVYLAGDHINQIRPDMSILERHNLSKNKYLLTVSSQSPHKNLEAVGRALDLLNCDIKIVFAGGQFPKVFNKAMISSARDKAVALGYINDRELKALYLNALGYIFPSYYEGFGLPILEAMHCGCPVLCARAASLPEIAGEAALFFEPANVNDIATSIEKIIVNETLRRELIQKGYQRSQAFSWRTAAHATLSALLMAVGSPL